MADKKSAVDIHAVASPENRLLANPRARPGSKVRYSRIIPLNLRTAQPDDPTSAPTSPSKSSASSTRRKSDEFDFDIQPGHGTDSVGAGAGGAGTGSGTASASRPGSIVGVPTSLQRSASSASERIIELRGSGKRSWIPPLNQLDSGSSLIMRRIQKNKERLSTQAQKESQIGLTELKQTFARQPHTGVNWEFWASVVGDYDYVARNQPEKLRKAIQDGFPAELRGLLWQVISSSKSSAMEQLYQSLVSVEDAPCISSITKDLDRTPMAKLVERESLARLLKAYSLFDPDVGYTQGMAFIAVPILMELPEAEAFSLFAQLMKVYDFRSVFIAEMPGLHLKLYQFDRLIEDNLETVHTHLKRQGVQSSMYASQWFLTMFAYRFPPGLVTRIFDIVIAEGLEAILRFALALIQVGAKKILKIQGIDELLPFLKDQIFDGYENDLVRLASEVTLSPQVLSKFELEFQELNRLEKERMMQMDILRETNARLSLQNKQLEAALEALNSEHVQIANKMVTNGMDLVHLTDENFELKEQVSALNMQVSDLNSRYDELKQNASKVDALKSELSKANNEKEELQQEIKLLQMVEDAEPKAALLKEVQQLKEIKSRYESQLGSLQESLASALSENR